MQNAAEDLKELTEIHGIDASNYFEACVKLMDVAIKEELYGMEYEDEDNLVFLEEYCKKHLAKFSEIFVVN